MKSFFEEYGQIIIVALVMLALIVFGVALTNNGTESMQKVIDNFGNKAELSSVVGESNNPDDNSGGIPGCDTITIQGQTLTICDRELIGVDWYDAESLVNELNAQNYKGVNDWRFATNLEAWEWSQTSLGLNAYNRGNEAVWYEGQYLMSSSGGGGLPSFPPDTKDPGFGTLIVHGVRTDY